jgi:hypothetical protein
MAGRIRSQKPEVIEDKTLASLTSDAFRLFIGAKSLADDHGNFRAEPAFLLGQVFWACPPLKPIEDVIAELAKAKVFELYEQSEQRYGHIRAWEKHERIDNAGAPRVPLPPGWVCEEEVRVEGRRSRSRWVSRRVVPNGAAPFPPMLTTPKMVPHHLAAPTSTAHDLVRPDLDHDHDHDQEGEAAAPAAPSPATPASGWSLSETGRRVARQLVTHADLFARLTAVEIAPFVERIDRELVKLDSAEVWPDVESEVDSWVTYARGKAEDRSMTPTQVLGAVEGLARTRCRERPGKARIERERRRSDLARVAPTSLDTADIGNEIAAADRELAEQRRQREATPPVDRRELVEKMKQATARIGRGGPL